MRVLMVGPTPPWAPNPYVIDLACELGVIPDVELTIAPVSNPYPAWFGPRSPVDAPWPPPGPFEVTDGVRWFAPWHWIGLGRGAWDLVHLQWWNYALLPEFFTIASAARSRGTPVVLTMHNADPHEASRLRRWANRQGAGFATHLVVQTPDTERLLLARGLPAERLTVIPHGYTPRPAVTSDERAAARVALGIADDTTVSLHFGAIRPYKRTHEVLERFAANGAGHLIVAGRPWGAYGEQVAALAALLNARPDLRGRLTLDLRTVDEPTKRRYFAASDVAVIAQAGMDAASGAAAEALAHGLAVESWADSETPYVPWSEAARATAALYRRLTTR
jgi:glycosyltransferase involved in cell wall biosynthesis